MQTFLPYPNFEQSAKCLDRLRLGKQRVEVLQLLKALTGADLIEKVDYRSTKPRNPGWYNHPAAKMWRGYESTLALYGDIVVEEWLQRGYKDTCRDKIRAIVTPAPAWDYPKPAWLGDPAFHAAHRSNLLRKDLDFYGVYGWTEPHDLPYIWPIP